MMSRWVTAEFKNSVRGALAERVWNKIRQSLFGRTGRATYRVVCKGKCEMQGKDLGPITGARVRHDELSSAVKKKHPPTACQKRKIRGEQQNAGITSSISRNKRTASSHHCCKPVL